MSAIVLKGSTSGTVTLQPAATISPNVTFTLPSVDGTSGQVLATNGSGTLSFITNDGTASFAAANSAGSYANGAFAKANTVNVNSQSAFDLANTLFDGTAAANVANLTSSGPITAQYITLDNSGYYGDIGFSGGGVAITANDTFVVQTNLAVDGEGGPLWEFGADGNLTVPGNISGANVITANTITSVNVISSNTVTANNLTVTGTLNVDGVNVLWHTPPTTSKGSAGDVAGLIAVDNDKIYRCVGTYDGTTDIWRYINFTGGTWG